MARFSRSFMNGAALGLEAALWAAAGELHINLNVGVYRARDGSESGGVLDGIE